MLSSETTNNKTSYNTILKQEEMFQCTFGNTSCNNNWKYVTNQILNLKPGEEYPTYCPLLKRMQSTCTVWVQSRNTCNNSCRVGHKSCQMHGSVINTCLLSTGHHLLSVSFVTSVKSNLWAAITTKNTTDNNCTTLHVQNATLLQPNVFLTRIQQFPSDKEDAPQY